jgi:DNA-binding XRE family transcriptional regulator
MECVKDAPPQDRSTSVLSSFKRQVNGDAWMLSMNRIRSNRDTLGTRVRDARTQKGITQRELAELIGVQYSSMISQIELGYISLPASLWIPVSETLSLNRCDWILDCLSEIQPQIFRCIFGGHPKVHVLDCLAKCHLTSG